MTGASKPRYVVVDTETTGLGHIGRPPREDGIVQVAFAWRDPATDLIRSSAWECDPGERYHANGRAEVALGIQKRSLQDVTRSPAAPLVSQAVHRQLERLGGPELRAYNVAFDRPFLQAAPWRINEAGVSWGPCIMLRAAETINGPQGKWPKLVEAAEALRVATGGFRLHSAAGDALLALLVEEAIEERQRLGDAAPPIMRSIAQRRGSE